MPVFNVPGELLLWLITSSDNIYKEHGHREKKTALSVDMITRTKRESFVFI